MGPKNDINDSKIIISVNGTDVKTPKNNAATNELIPLNRLVSVSGISETNN